ATTTRSPFSSVSTRKSCGAPGLVSGRGSGGPPPRSERAPEAGDPGALASWAPRSTSVVLVVSRRPRVGLGAEHVVLVDLDLLLRGLAQAPHVVGERLVLLPRQQRERVLVALLVEVFLR